MTTKATKEGYTPIQVPKYDPRILAQIQSKDVLNGILRGYMASPSDIRLYPIDPLDISSDAYQDMFTIMNIFSQRNIQSIDKARISAILKEPNLDLHCANSPSALSSLEKTLYTLRDATDLNRDGAIKNLPSYYNQQSKYFTLRELYKRGANISDFFIADTETGMLNDTEYREQARKNLENNSAEQIRTIVLSGLQEAPTLKSRSHIPLLRPDDLPHANDKITWIVKNVIRHNSFNSIVGAAKAGKSQCAMQLSFCIKNGLYFLDERFPTEQAEVLYVDFELEDNEIKNRYDMLKIHYNLPKAESPYVFALKNQFTSGQVDMDYIIAEIKKYKALHPDIKFVVFDCYYTFSKGDSNSEEDVWKTLQPLKALSGAENDLTVLYVHHTNKNGVNMDNAIYAAGGSGVHGKVVDTSIVIGAKTTGRQNKVIDDIFVLKAVGRSGGFKDLICDRSEGNQFFFTPIEEEDIRVTNAMTQEEFKESFPKTYEAFMDAENHEIPIRNKVYTDIVIPEFKKHKVYKDPESILFVDKKNHKAYLPRFQSTVSDEEVQANENALAMADLIKQTKEGVKNGTN